jgi:curved DNA-binding protein CbpA
LNVPDNQAPIDYYDVLKVSPSADTETIQHVFQLLEARLHPDNGVSGDAEKFRLAKDACETLCDAERRAAYDVERASEAGQTSHGLNFEIFAASVEGEINRRIGVLCLLYESRRANEDKPGLSIMILEKEMGVSAEQLAFAVWYLKNKLYVTSGQSSDMVITSEGMDYLESLLPKVVSGKPKEVTAASDAAPAAERRTQVRVVQ